jgi:autotransporter passenger strand-loop-strand repeat protein
MISNGGTQNVAGRAITVATTIESGGTEIVSVGGNANSTTVSAGGTLNVLAGGTATAPDLRPGGAIHVGGTLVIESQSVTVSSGGIVLGGVAEVVGIWLA